MAHADNFPGLTQPDDSYHGVNYAKDFGEAAYITKATAQLMRDLGSIPSPAQFFSAEYRTGDIAPQGTAPLRKRNGCREIPRIQKGRGQSGWGRLSGLPNSTWNSLVKKCMPGGTKRREYRSALPGRVCGRSSVSRTGSGSLAAVVTHVADARTCVLHPASTTHRQLSDVQLESCGVMPDMIRLSVRH